MSEAKHIIKTVLKGSIAEEFKLKPGDAIISINDQVLEDIFDYQYLTEDDYIEVLVEKKNGKRYILEIDKDYDEDLGIEFENGLMDKYRSCHNKCIFCFIDQMPKGMRPNLYFKDDDSRLSFLHGNYVTLTNMSDHDVERICNYHLSPINISFQTMNPELRCMMLNNRFAGEALAKVDKFYEAGIIMNGQIVLCKGVNDGDELKFSIEQMMKYAPNLQSVSVVPVGLSKYREGLYELEPFEKDDCAKVIDLIESYQKKCFEQFGLHFIHASDEFYIVAGREVPEEDRYDGYLQLENGVGMMRLFINETNERMEEISRNKDLYPELFEEPFSREVSVATGKLAYPFIEDAAKKVEKLVPGFKCNVYPIRNDFFGERITVSGLLTGQDIKAQLMGKELGDELLLPENVVQFESDLFLDDMHLYELENALQVKANIVKSSGHEFVDGLLGI